MTRIVEHHGGKAARMALELALRGPLTAWLSQMVAVLKTGIGGNLDRGFESHPRRSLARLGPGAQANPSSGWAQG